MSNSETISDSNLDTLCIPLGAAVSAKFRGAFCEAIVSKVDRKLYCRIQLDDKKTIKVRADDIIGIISANSKVKFHLDNNIVSGIILKVIDNSVYHVVFNDDDTGILRRNQLVLKGDRHYKLSECLDRHPLTNPEQFTKAVINDKRMKDKSDVDEEEFDNEEAKSCSQESMTTVSSSKTRSRQQTVASSASVGTGGSSVTVKTIDDVQKPVVSTMKTKKHVNIKYSLGSLVIVNKTMTRLGMTSGEKQEKKVSPFVGVIVASSLCDGDLLAVKPTQCVVKSFRDNNCFIVYKRDLEVIVKRDQLVRHKQSDPSVIGYIDKCMLFFDTKTMPDQWEQEKLLPVSEYYQSVAADDTADSDRAPSKKSSKMKTTTTTTTNQSPRTSLSSLDSGSDNNDDDDRCEVRGSEPSTEDDQNAKDEWVARFFGFWEDKGSPINSALEIGDSDVDIYRLYELVKDYGGFQKVTTTIRWPHLYHLLRLPQPTSENYLKLQTLYKKYIFPYVDMKKKLGSFEQIRNRRLTERTVVATVRKARPLLTARERREYQVSVKKTMAAVDTVTATSGCCAVSSERLVDDSQAGGVASGDDVLGGGCLGERTEPSGGSVTGDGGHVSQCSSVSARDNATTDKSVTGPGSTVGTTATVSGGFPPGTLVSVAYGGDDKIYKAKIINQHSFSGGHKSPLAVASSSSSLLPQSLRPASSTLYQPMASVDSVSNGESTTSTTTTGNINDLRSSDMEVAATNNINTTTTLYRVHYIGWNNRHDEIIASDRIVAVLSDNGQTDSGQSVCSSTTSGKECHSLLDQAPDITTVSSVMLPVTESDNHSQPVIDGGDNDDDDDRLLLPEMDDVSVGTESCDSLVVITDDRDDNKIDTTTTTSYQQPINDNNKNTSMPVTIKRRRSRSACVLEPVHIVIKRMPIVPESRIIASLNLYKTGDKMPKRPVRKQVLQKDEKQSIVCGLKDESDRTVTESSSGSKRHSNTTDDSEVSSKIPKIEAVVSVKCDNKVQSKIKRPRSPSFSNESLSDASTISFRNVDEQSLYYLSGDNDDDYCTRKDEKTQQKPMTKIGNKRGRKPLHKHDKKLPGSTRKIRDPKCESLEMESTSSQHSGSVHGGKRVTRSVKTTSDHNTMDDNSMQLEDDSQTSQDGSGFQLPPLLQSDSKHTLLVPLATGTPTSSHKGRRPKPRRKVRNSQSNSSGECNYQDSVGEQNNNYSFISDHFSQPKILDHSPTNNSHIRPPGRSFQRLHPSLIPNDLQKLPPEERVKLLESLIRQTHLNFLDTKDKIKYVEKRISEIKTSRANGHSIESDEDKFR